MNDHDTLDFVHGQWSKLTNFDHLTTVILKFWLWSWSKIFDHLTGVGQMVKELWSSYPPPSLFRRLVSSNHSQPRPMAWRRYILPDPAKKKISGQYSTHYSTIAILTQVCHVQIYMKVCLSLCSPFHLFMHSSSPPYAISHGILGLQLHKDKIVFSERKIHVAKYTLTNTKLLHKLLMVVPKSLDDIIITKLTSYIAGSSEYSRRRGHGR